MCVVQTVGAHAAGYNTKRLGVQALMC